MPEQSDNSWFIPEWPAPDRVAAAITTRCGGYSGGPYLSNNLALHVGDDAQIVTRNRNQLTEQLSLVRHPQWLEQIHGSKVVEAVDDGVVRTADGSFTQQAGLACVVLTADCLPVLLCNETGTQVAAVHAGWRGLAGGVIESAVDTFSDAPESLMAYLGPAIGPTAFEVGVDVLEVFFEVARTPDHADAIASCFTPSRQRPLHFLANLYELARAELQSLGVTRHYGGNFCTFSDEQRFYSYRRDGVTGRMASLIWLR